MRKTKVKRGENLKGQKAITLIALVITIVVLLILAAVAISTLTGENGILTRAREAKIKTELAKVQESLDLKISQIKTDSYVTSGQDANISVEDIDGLAKLVRINDEEKDIYIVKDLGKIDTSSTIGNGAIPSTDEIDSISNFSDLFIIDQSNKVFYIGDKIYGEGEIDGVKKIIGSSRDWLVEGDKLVKYLGTLNKDTNIVIPNYVDATKMTTIGAEIFKNAQSTGTLTISQGIEVIEDSAFGGSSFTGNLTIPNSVTYIGNGVFNRCSGFTGNLTISNNIISIGNGAFYYCNGFTGNLTIPNSVISIGNNAFEGCSGFTGDLIIPDSVKTIGSVAFNCVGLKGELSIPNSVTNLSGVAFPGTNFSKITVDTTIVQGQSATNWNKTLTTLTIGNNVKTISQSAFSGCSSITGNLEIPDSVQAIEKWAFYGCSGFTGELIIPHSVTSIGENAFANCSGFTGDLVIKSNVQTIGTEAFSGCSKISSLTLEGIASGIGTDIFKNNNFTKLIINFTNIPNSFKDTLSTMGVFSSKNDMELELTEKVEEIGDNAFGGIQYFIGELKIPISVKTIGDYAFANNSKFTKLNLSYHEPDFSGESGATVSKYNLKKIGEDAFFGCTGFTGTLRIPYSVEEIGNEAFMWCSGFTGNLYIPSSVCSIGSMALSHCSGITSITIDNTSNYFSNVSDWGCDISIITYLK